jgi:hypothetical protein
MVQEPVEATAISAAIHSIATAMSRRQTIRLLHRNTTSRCSRIRGETPAIYFTESTSRSQSDRFEHFPRLAAIRRADDAVLVHHIQNARGATLAQTQPALQYGCRCLIHVEEHAKRFLVHRILFAGSLLLSSASVSAGGAIRKVWSYSGLACSAASPN